MMQKISGRTFTSHYSFALRERKSLKQTVGEGFDKEAMNSLMC